MAQKKARKRVFYVERRCIKKPKGEDKEEEETRVTDHLPIP